MTMGSLHEKQVRLDHVIPLIRQQLEAGQTVRFSPRGTSMLPMLRQGVDQVVLSPLPETLRRFDLPLYQRDNGQYVLHRIVNIHGEEYICLGDNQFIKERGLRRDQMIAMVSAFYRGEKRYEVTDVRYRIYVRIWYATRHLRRFFRRGLSVVRRLLK